MRSLASYAAAQWSAGGSDWHVMVLVMFTSTLVMKLTELPRQDIGFTDGICIDKGTRP